MGFFALFKKRKHNFDNEEILQESIRRAEEIRSLKHERRVLEHQKNIAKEQYSIAKTRDEIAFYQGQTEPQQQEQAPDEMAQLTQLMMLFNAFQGNKGEQNGNLNDFMAQFSQGNTTPIGFPPQSNQSGFNAHSQQENILNSGAQNSEVGFTDDEIREQLKLLSPDKIKMAKKLPVQMIKSYMRKRYDFDENTIDRALVIIKKEM